MRPGATGPPHTFDAEQVWTVLDGEALALSPGDTVVLPAWTV